MYKGHATYFYQNNTPGACGIVHQDSDYVVALDYRTYGNTSQRSQYCGRKVAITSDTGKTLTATVADACPTCDMAGSLDLSEGLFAAFHDLGVGLFDITWRFV
jgi:expansin (peptidoglycan-binding protein)